MNAPQDRSGEVSVGGERILRFESGAPDLDGIMNDLRVEPPNSLGGRPVEIIAGDSTEAVLQVGDCRVVVRPRPETSSLHITGESPLDDRRFLVSSIDAVAAMLGDPERRRAQNRFRGEVLPSDDDVEARAQALVAGAPTTIERDAAIRLAIACIDLTTLTGDDTPGRVRALCAQALRPDPVDPTVGPTAAVCVYPNLVSTAVEILGDSPAAVASVAGAFPSGLSSLAVRLADIDDAVAAGADEVDVVINRAALLAGDRETAASELRAMRERVGDRVLKVILETSELATGPAIRAAAQIAIGAGAEWIKTSTGKTSSGATPAAVLTMAEVIAAHEGPPVGVKISGGVRTTADALGYLALIESALGPKWLHPDRLRFGASGLLNALVGDLS